MASIQMSKNWDETISNMKRMIIEVFGTPRWISELSTMVNEVRDRTVLVKLNSQMHPINDLVIYHVFTEIGTVEDVRYMSEESGFHSRVRFRLKSSSDWAFHYYNGRRLHQGCCELDIHRVNDVIDWNVQRISNLKDEYGIVDHPMVNDDDDPKVVGIVNEGKAPARAEMNNELIVAENYGCVEFDVALNQAEELKRIEISGAPIPAKKHINPAADQLFAEMPELMEREIEVADAPIAAANSMELNAYQVLDEIPEFTEKGIELCDAFPKEIGWAASVASINKEPSTLSFDPGGEYLMVTSHGSLQTPEESPKPEGDVMNFGDLNQEDERGKHENWKASNEENPSVEPLIGSDDQDELTVPEISRLSTVKPLVLTTLEVNTQRDCARALCFDLGGKLITLEVDALRCLEVTDASRRGKPPLISKNNRGNVEESRMQGSATDYKAQRAKEEHGLSLKTSSIPRDEGLVLSPYSLSIIQPQHGAVGLLGISPDKGECIELPVFDPGGSLFFDLDLGGAFSFANNSFNLGFITLKKRYLHATYVDHFELVGADSVIYSVGMSLSSLVDLGSPLHAAIIGRLTSVKAKSAQLIFDPGGKEFMLGDHEIFLSIENKETLYVCLSKRTPPFNLPVVVSGVDLKLQENACKQQLKRRVFGVQQAAQFRPFAEMEVAWLLCGFDFRKLKINRGEWHWKIAAERSFFLDMLLRYYIILACTFHQDMGRALVLKMKLPWRKQGILESHTSKARVSFQGEFGGATSLDSKLTETDETANYSWLLEVAAENDLKAIRLEIIWSKEGTRIVPRLLILAMTVTFAHGFWFLRSFSSVYSWAINVIVLVFDPGGRRPKLAGGVHHTSSC